MTEVAKRDLTAELTGTLPKASGADKVLREEALAIFKQSGLPAAKHEEYRFTPIARMLEREFDTLNTATPPSDVDSISQFLVPGLDADVLVFVNGGYSEALSKITSSDITIKSLAKALVEDTVPVLNILGKKAAVGKDNFTALNTAAWSDGLYVHVGENVTARKPLFILYVNDTKASRIVQHVRIVVHIEKRATLNIIEKFESVGDHAAFATVVEEIALEQSATLNYYKVQNDHGKAIQVCNTAIYQGDRSHVNTFTLTLEGMLVRNNLSIFIDGEYCESHFHGLYLLSGNTLCDNHTVVDHLKPNSFSNELYKGVMDMNAKGVFNGKIFVRPHAQKTNAFQSNRNVLLTDTATVNTKPQLEIWADDVKCSHGCTSGQLDEEALFYLRSRGIGKDQARAMLLYAFASEVIATIQDDQIRSYFDELIAARLHKNF